MPVTPDAVKSVFFAALDHTPAERAAFLDATCSTDAELRARIEAMLRAAEADDPLLDRPAAAFLDPELLAPRAELPSVEGYEIQGVLGRGGMGVVYRARSLALGRVCALKVILAGTHSSAEEVERFKSEAQAVARLSHPGIVQIYEVGEQDGRPFMALEFCSGGTLAARLAMNPLPAKEAAEVVRALADAVQAAHDANVIHRDLKPANVLLSSPLAPSPLHSSETKAQTLGIPKITDFGLVKKLDEQGQTTTGNILGTPSYMPPEQAQGRKDIGPAADVYALGAILFECLASRPPFRAATAYETLLQVLNEEPVAVRQLNPQAPIDLETIAHKCLNKDPARRYAKAQHLADDLGRYLHGEPIVARPVGAAERAVKWVRRNGVVSALAAGILLALTAGVAVSGWFAYTAGEEARNARHAESEAKKREQAEGVAKALAQKATDRAEQQLRLTQWMVYSGKLSLAQSAFAEGNALAALQHLEACQWDLRGWEHRHLWGRLNSRQKLYKHTGSVLAVGWSPDGRHIVSAGSDKTARIWDAARGTLVLALKGHTDVVNAVAYSPDGARLLTASKDKTAKVWDARRGTEILTLKGHSHYVTGVAWSPDGTRLATTAFDGSVMLSDAHTGAVVRTIKAHSMWVLCVAFSKNGKRIVTGSGDKTAKVWDAEQGTEILQLKGHTGEVWCVAYSPDGRRILTGSLDKTTRLWDAQKGEECLSLKGNGAVMSAAFSPDGTRIATGILTHQAAVWDAHSGQQMFSLAQHTGAVRGVAFSPDGSRLVTGSFDRTVRVWDAHRGLEPLALQGHEHWVTSAVFSGDGKRVLTGSWDNTAKVWDAQSGQNLLTLRGHTRTVSSVAFSPDGRRILTGSLDKTARVWDAEKGTEIFSKRHPDMVPCVAFSKDGKRILTGCNNTARLFDAEEGSEVHTLSGHANRLLSAAFSRDGARIITGSADKTARVWDAMTGKALYALVGHTDAVVSVTFSHDGKRIATGSADKTAMVWDAEQGARLLTLLGDTTPVRAVAFSPDGTRILTGSDAEARLYDAHSGQEVLIIKGHTIGVSSVAWSTDGKRALTGSFDKTARLWDAEKGQTTLTLKGHTNDVTAVTFGDDGKRLFAWDEKGKLLAWSIVSGLPAETHDPPEKPTTKSARLPDGRLAASADGWTVRVTDLREQVHEGESWPLPDTAQRRHYHTYQAALAEKQKRHFAVAYHLGRLLLDDPENAEWKQRRDAALVAHDVVAPESLRK